MSFFVMGHKLHFFTCAHFLVDLFYAVVELLRHPKKRLGEEGNEEKISLGFFG